MKETILFCGKLDDGAFFHFYLHTDLVKMCGHDEVFRVKVTEVELIPNVSEQLDKSAEGYFGWWDDEKQEFQFVAPNLHCVEICFPYGSKAEAERGRGNVYRVNVEVLEDE